MSTARSWPKADFLTLRYRPAQETGCPYRQLDLRGRNAPDGPTQQWLTTGFLPHAAGQFGGGAYLAYLLSPTLLATR